MKDKNNKRSGRALHALICAVSAVGIFLGVFALLAVSLALISGGMFIVPTAILRITDRGDVFVSDLPQYTMLFLGLAMLFSGLAVLVASVCRICPAAAKKLLKELSGGDR